MQRWGKKFYLGCPAWIVLQSPPQLTTEAKERKNMSDNERDTRPPQPRQGDDLYTWSGDSSNGNSNGKKCAQPNGKADLYKFDGSNNASTDDTSGNHDHVPTNWHPDLSLSSPSAQEWFKESQALRKQKLDLDQNGDHVVAHGDSLWTIAQRELHDTGKQGSNQEIEAEMARIAKLNDHSHPSLMGQNPGKDFIGDGWKLHIERRDHPHHHGPTGDDSGDKQCVPKGANGEVTPPGYQAKPSVIVNNVYTDNAYFDQRPNGSGGPSGSDQPDRVLPNRGNDVYRYSGDQQPPGNGNGGDLYRYSGDGGDASVRRQNPGQSQGDVYRYGGDGGGQTQGQNQGDTYQYGGDQRQVGSGQDQRHHGRPDRVIINNVQAENAYFNQSGGNFERQPCNRMMGRNPVQSGEDNYYNQRPRGVNNGRIVPMNDTGDGNYQTSYPTDQTQNPNGTASTDYYTYSGNNGGNQTGNYYANARSQQGVQLDSRPANYRGQSGDNTDDSEYTY
jgi:hypothetical protein